MNDSLLNAYRFHRAANVSATGGARDYPAPRQGYAAAAALHRARYDIDAGKSRYGAPEPACLSRQTDGTAHVSKPAAFGLRHVGDVVAESYGGRDCWNKRDHGGWYTDPYGDVFKDGSGLCWGVVYQLPGRNGKARFVAGYEFGGTDGGPTLDLSKVYESDPSESGVYDTDARDLTAARDAARHADALAKYAAKEERDYQTAWQAGSRWAELGDEVADARKAALAILRERRAVMWSTDDGKPPQAICAAIRDRLRSYLRDIAEARSKRANLAKGDHDSLIFYPDERLRAAFNEGAGANVLA